MSTLPVEQKRRSPLDVVAQWWRNWTSGSELRDAACCAEGEVERAARDLGVSAPELRRLARLGPHAADLLLRRMAALNLDRNEVSRTETRTFQDLQRVCSLCEHHRRCARELDHDPNDPAWQGYCPNVATLKALDAMPWASRKEW